MLRISNSADCPFGSATKVPTPCKRTSNPSSVRSRSARFVCNIAAVLPDGRVLHTEETMEGMIAEEPAGSGGFGYDPILFLPEYGLTSAEITMEEKNKISHRGKALRAMKAALEKVLKREMERTQDENINCQ